MMIKRLLSISRHTGHSLRNTGLSASMSNTRDRVTEPLLARRGLVSARSMDSEDGGRDPRPLTRSPPASPASPASPPSAESMMSMMKSFRDLGCGLTGLRAR